MEEGENGEGGEGLAASTGEKGEGVGESGGEEGGGGGGGEKGTVGGTGHTSPPLSATPVIPSSTTMFSVLQLECLMRVHMMMAQLHGVGSQPHWDLTMAALGYCTIIWKVRGPLTALTHA